MAGTTLIFGAVVLLYCVLGMQSAKTVRMHLPRTPGTKIRLRGAPRTRLFADHREYPGFRKPYPPSMQVPEELQSKPPKPSIKPKIEGRFRIVSG